MTTDHATRLVADTLTSAALRFGVELRFDVDELFEQVVLDRASTRASSSPSMTQPRTTATRTR